ncbi:hexose transporter HXT6 [Saccharomyces cerevisiae S288C]|uniref:High-affinity hexose transporter HXT6 n=2 Tax=Dikarya TaxID=451864 RepID=HXT6_YEAST|nr:hexose transporter HXT6 [Saccharomyces cerevisiae S288C]P39003.2 RecName: Full=High-affinity hexose transporter HXT6 [Saccharomyces cerevisiae S288C]AAB64779.1 Hxt6p: Hexose transporter (Swiss Prot. accession number P39003) [Saccharomyces cerevisiae]AJU91661.1 Hxt6p [Saccharomyces cerevisiae YJM1311]WNF20163.1 HXT6 [Saccharomyces cerevisiae synthetic construct]DAA12184.1 TPA: hexose transporter HXT6 [Saccharomyces cerevisiae S288C]|eukprot:NP_010630.1 hexose transporter HXT6 [Saccharomyces cerevisiae S288C]
MSQDAAIAEQTPVEHLSAVDSASHSVLSTPSNKAERDEIKAYGEGEEHEPVVEIPKRPASAYVTVSIMCIMIAFGGFVFGWDTGTISGFINQTDFIRRFGMKHKDGTNYLSKVRTGLIVSIFNIGCAIGGIILSKLGDMYGRKVGLIVVVVIYIIGIIIQIASINKWYQYFIGRIISGLGVGGIAVLSPMLISEVSPKHLRGTLVSCYQLMITAGIFLGYCTNFGTKNYSNSVQWRVPLGLCFAWALFMIGGMTFVPESPRYLAEVGKIEEAKRSIAVSNKVAVDDPSVLAEVEAVLAGVEAEKLAGNASWGELFSSKTKVLQRLIMGAMIQSLQQLTGDNYFFYYGTTIFKAVGLSDSFETSIVLGIVNFASTFVGIYVVERYGRRTCLLWGAASMTACMVVYASVGVTRLWPNGQDQPSSKGAGNCMIVFACFYIFCFATTWAPIPYVVVSETFPLRVKSKAMSIATAANWLWGFLIGFFTPFITGAINFYYGYVFMGCLVFMFFYVLLVVPETKGLTLEEVNTMWEEGVLPWKSASWVPPSRRGANYDAEEMAHDDKPLYKRMFSTK